MTDKITVIVEVNGGLVQDVYSSDPDSIKVILIDWDNPSVDVDYGVLRVTPEQTEVLVKQAAEEEDKVEGYR